jgi:hypothetical protein
MNNASELLQQAAKIVSDDRAITYGSKRTNHENIARLWGAYLRREVTPQDVALMMILLKIARTQLGTGSVDNYVDMAGYAGIAGEIFNG